MPVPSYPKPQNRGARSQNNPLQLMLTNHLIIFKPAQVIPTPPLLSFCIN